LLWLGYRLRLRELLLRLRLLLLLLVGMLLVGMLLLRYLLLLLLLGLLLSLLLGLLLGLVLSLLLGLVLLLLVLLLLLLLMLLLRVLLLLEGGGHRLSPLFLLHKLLYLGMCGRRMCVLELWDRGWARGWPWRHLLRSLWVVEWGIGHIGIVVRRRWCLRGVRLRRREVGAWSADVGSRARSREVSRLR
jgi:hypothetical protein